MIVRTDHYVTWPDKHLGMEVRLGRQARELGQRNRNIPVWL